MNILLINGYERHIDSNGRLNQKLYNNFLNQVRTNNDIRVSSVTEYNRIDEINKFFWADLIFIQFPIYWFEVPGALKKYLDDIFVFNEFYTFSGQYGAGGLMKNKKYLISTTWNAPKQAFNDKNEFFEGHTVDDVLFPIYCAFKYIGMVPLTDKPKSLSFHDVIKNPDIPNYIKEMNQFISTNIQ